MTFFTTFEARQCSCFRILDIFCYFHLFSIFTNTLNTSFLTCANSTTTSVIGIHCINDTVPGLLVHFNIIWSPLMICNHFCWSFWSRSFYVRTTDVKRMPLLPWPVIFPSFYHTPSSLVRKQWVFFTHFIDDIKCLF